MGMDEGKLSEVVFKGVVRLGKFPIKQSCANAEHHVGKRATKQLLQMVPFIRDNPIVARSAQVVIVQRIETGMFPTFSTGSPTFEGEGDHPVA